MSFFTDYLADAKKAAASCKGMFVSVILAQWAIETGNGGSKAFVSGNNFAGISYSGVSSFPTKAAGLEAYIETINHTIYDPVRQASGWQAQCVALGQSPWAASHYNDQAYKDGVRGAALLANAGISLIDMINQNNLTQYDGAATNNPSTNVSSSSSSGIFTPPSPGPTINPPAFGFASNIASGDITINGQALDINIQGALVTAELDLSISEASTFTLTLNDPDRILINSGIFSQASIVALGGLIGLQFALVSVEKAQDVLTATFEAYIVAALRSATGAITVAPGHMSRTQFAKNLVGQVAGATFAQAPATYLQTIGYDINSREQLSALGTSSAPAEDSWTCLQRLASEIQWVCFESYGTVYFGPYQWLAAQSPVMQPVEWSGGIDTIDGTYDVGQPLGNLTITAKADSWIPIPGDCILLQNLGPFSNSGTTPGIWIVAEMDRPDVMEPDITITLMQPLPYLPEPSSGGAAAAVGAGTVNPTLPQTTGGSTAAAGAVAFCVKQLGKPYGWGDTGPAAYDCSGLVQAAYASVGVPIPRTTFQQFPTGAGTAVPPGITNLKPGDLVYFEGGDGSPTSPGHVAIVTKTNKTTNVVTVIDAYEMGTPIRYDTYGYVNPGGNTSFAGKYFGALRPVV